MANKKRPVQDIEDAPQEAEMKLFMRQFEVIKKWRNGRIADVDVYGCDKLAEEAVDAKVRIAI